MPNSGSRDQEPEKIQKGGVGPLEVFKTDDQRGLFRLSLQG